MAQFRGTMRGQRGEASRLGSKKSGLEVNAASWQGAVSVRLWHDDKTDKDMTEVALTKHHGAGIECVLYHGPVGGVKRCHLCLDVPGKDGLGRVCKGCDGSGIVKEDN